jgi:hypothetical protein
LEGEAYRLKSDVRHLYDKKKGSRKAMDRDEYQSQAYQIKRLEIQELRIVSKE